MPDDDVIGLAVRTEKYTPYGFNDDERERTFVVVRVNRKRKETDEEYFARQKKEAKEKADFEEKEKLEYLRLKAKFEGNDNE